MAGPGDDRAETRIEPFLRDYLSMCELLGALDVQSFVRGSRAIDGPGPADRRTARGRTTTTLAAEQP